MIHQDGYYLGGIKQYDDAIGGNIIHFTLCEGYWFVDNRHVLSLTIRNHYTTQLSKEQFINRVTINRYSFEERVLTIIRNYDTKFAMETNYIMLSDELFKNEADLFSFKKW